MAEFSFFGRTNPLNSFQLRLPSMFTYQINWLHVVVRDKSGPGHFKKGAPERQEPSRAWLGVEPQTDTTGSRNKHSYNMAFVTWREREKKRKRRERSAHRPLSSRLKNKTQWYTRIEGHALLLVWHNPYVPLQHKKIHEWSNAFLLVGVWLCQKSRFHVQYHAFLQALPPRRKNWISPRVRITYRNKKIKENKNSTREYK